MISLDSILAQQPDEVATAEIASKVMCLNIDAGKYYTLNEVGSRLFQLLEQPRRVSDLLQTLAQEYDMPSGRATDESLTFLQSLLDRKLVRIVDVA